MPGGCPTDALAVHTLYADEVRTAASHGCVKVQGPNGEKAQEIHTPAAALTKKNVDKYAEK